MPYMVADIWVQKDTLKRQHIGRLWEHQTIPALSHTSVAQFLVVCSASTLAEALGTS
jgi:hypothetical protein